MGSEKGLQDTNGCVQYHRGTGLKFIRWDTDTDHEAGDPHTEVH